MRLADLAAPFPVEAIHWRAQSLAERDGKFSALALAYIDARDVQDRLDQVAGPQNWATSYDETLKGRVFCRLSIKIGDEWVTKTDGAGATDVEGEKGAISDALKRAAVNWGIGRYLYDLGNTWAPCEVNTNKKWRKWKPEADKVFQAALARFMVISEEQRTELISILEATGFPVADFLKISKIDSLKQLPADKFNGACEWLHNQKKEK